MSSLTSDHIKSQRVARLQTSFILLHLTVPSYLSLVQVVLTLLTVFDSLGAFPDRGPK